MGFGADFAGHILNGLGRAALGGGLLFLAVWVICRLAPRIPAPVRFWLWWLVPAKLLLGLAAIAPITLTLPVSQKSLPTLPPALSRLSLLPAPPRARVVAAAPAPAEQTAEAEEKEQAARPVAPSPAPAPRLLISIPWVLLTIWTIGAALTLCWQTIPAWRLRRLVAESLPLPEDEETVETARTVGLRRTPRVVVSEAATGPFVTGLLRPTIVLPLSLLDSLSSAEARLTLAHEMAHIRRGDLWLGLAPLLARALFWFLPPVWLACRELAQCREEACDRTAVKAVGAAPAVYGGLLLKTVGAQRMTLAAPGMAAVHYGQVRRRLLSLTTVSTPGMRLFGAVCLSGAGLSLIPLRLAAQAEAIAERLVNVTAPPALPTYTLTDLGTLGGEQSDALGISKDGAFVVGGANLRPGVARGHAFVWNGGKMTDLATGASSPHSLAHAVNTSGQVAAMAYSRTDRPTAFFWDGKERRLLGSLPGYRYTRALDVNESGHVVGNAQKSGRNAGAIPSRPFLWRDGKMTDLGTLGGPFGFAFAISDKGRIVGKADLHRAEDAPTGETHAFLWEDGKMADLGTLPGGKNSLAFGVNDRGLVVGWSETANGKRAFVWQDGLMTELPIPTLTKPVAPGTAIETIAYGINMAGWIVGEVTVGSGKEAVHRAVAWHPVVGGYEALDLTDRLARTDTRRNEVSSDTTLEVARRISDSGEIVGVARVGGKPRAVLLKGAL